MRARRSHNLIFCDITKVYKVWYNIIGLIYAVSWYTGLGLGLESLRLVARDIF